MTLNKNMEISKIEEKMKGGGISPSEISDLILESCAEYGWNASQLEEIIKVKPVEWMKFRMQVTSDKQADRNWEQTELGINEGVYRLRLKRIEKIISALKTKLSVIQGESKNLW